MLIDVLTQEIKRFKALNILKDCHDLYMLLRGFNVKDNNLRGSKQFPGPEPGQTEPGQTEPGPEQSVSLIIQVYDDRYWYYPMIRLLYSKGMFLYAYSIYGWIPYEYTLDQASWLDYHTFINDVDQSCLYKEKYDAKDLPNKTIPPAATFFNTNHCYKTTLMNKTFATGYAKMIKNKKS